MSEQAQAREAIKELPVVALGPTSRVWFDEEAGKVRAENVVIYRKGKYLIGLFDHQEDFDRMVEAIALAARESTPKVGTGTKERSTK